MVRARRVRAVVACATNDECCSPNPKRKDQSAVKCKLSHNSNKTITHFFHVVKNDHLPDAALEDTNDLDDADKEEFKELPDVALDDYKEDKLPSTPHRIELREDIKEFKDLQLQKLEWKVEFKRLPLLHDDVTANEIKEEIIALEAEEGKLEASENEDVKVKVVEVGEGNLNGEMKTKTATKANGNSVSKTRRRLNNNQSSNQQPTINKSNTTIKHKNDTDNKQNHTLTEYFPVRRSVRKTKKTVLEEKQRTLEDILKRGVEDGLEVHNFEGKGRGIVAMRLFNRGDFVVEYAGDLIDMQEARRREIKYAQDQNAGCYMYYFKHKITQYCIDATAETGRLGRLVNHSRNGNLITRVIDINGKPRLVLVAKDTIQLGEEVTYDYGDRSKESLKHHPWLAY